ncbi:hypothetical protein DOTSEDRAFT_35974 [Dothistroma septosporum NZE10]|uniref:Uncharacterized protein n=1 Tax=Dothistroma septosporum (strain NZE10 / CBS 128990) TaxID=675120 RepID=N1PHC5_DOTSN|nr:hypothetical protein DOTSEDRAFT_35974 [Dothistroma septosporum NZE10]
MRRAVLQGLLFESPPPQESKAKRLLPRHLSLKVLCCTNNDAPSLRWRCCYCCCRGRGRGRVPAIARRTLLAADTAELVGRERWAANRRRSLVLQQQQQQQQQQPNERDVHTQQRSVADERLCAYSRATGSTWFCTRGMPVGRMHSNAVERFPSSSTALARPLFCWPLPDGPHLPVLVRGCRVVCGWQSVMWPTLRALQAQLHY